MVEILPEQIEDVEGVAPGVPAVAALALGLDDGEVGPFGAGLGEVFARGETPDLGIIFQPAILLPILGLCLLAALPLLLNAVRGKKGL